MKILHLVQGYHPAIGGTEFLIKNISEKLVSSFGDEVTVFTTNAYNCEGFVVPSSKLMRPGEEEINGVKVKRFPVFNRLGRLLYYLQAVPYKARLPFNDRLRNLYSGPIVFRMIPEIIRFDCDVVAASSFPLLHMYYASFTKRFTNRPLVLIGGLHTEDDWGFNRSTIFKTIRRADAYVAYSTHERDFLVKKGLREDKIHVVGCGVEIGAFNNADGASFRRDFNLDSNPVVAFIGQQGGDKGIDTLIRSMPLVWKKIPETRLVIAGAPTNFTPHMHNIIQTLDRRDHRKIVILNNFSENKKKDILAACDVFVSPSAYESFGITFLEAWISGKPVISTRQGAIPTVVDERQNGLLINYGNHAELASVILELLNDANLRDKLARHGREKVLSRYTWDIVARRFREVYQKVI